MYKGNRCLVSISSARRGGIPTEGKRHNRWTVLFTGFFPGELNVGFVTASLSMLMYEMAGELGLSGFQSGIVLGTFPAALMAFGIFGGALTDTFGAARMFGVGLILSTIPAMARFLVFSFETLLLLSLLSNIGVALIVPTLTKMVSTLFERESQGLAVGILAVGYRLCSALTILSTPILLASLSSWRTVFLLYGVFGIIIASTYQYVARASSLTKMMPVEQSHRHANIYGGLRHVLKVRAVKMTALSRIFQGGFILSLSAFLPFMLRLTGAAILATGILAGTFWASQAAGALLIPRLSDKIRKRSSLVVNLGVLSFLLVLVLMFWWGNLLISLMIISVLGFIFAGLTEVMWLIPLSDPEIRNRHAGAATGIVVTAGSGGGIVASLTMGYLLDTTAGILPSLALLAALTLLMALTQLGVKE